MSVKLRELIRAVRACKTASDERGVIAKECALIRTSFKAPDNPFRHRNVAKLLYMHMLGYPTHFGQMECVKLIASPTFPEKRIGYLGLMILLDEKHQVLMLVTNSLKNDFSNKNPYIVGLALASLGNICSSDMARDLANEVEKFFRHQNAYIRKKAALCAIRIIRKVPELIEEFQGSVTNLLNDKNHAVLLTAVCLIIEMIKLDEKLIVSTFRKIVPTIVRLLKNLVLAGYVSEYDVVGITDPFLQCKLIHLLRVLGTGDREASDFMNDILAQVSINCFTPDHEVLTRQGFMSLEAIESHFAQHESLEVACPVDGRLEYHSIGADKLIKSTGEHTLIDFQSESSDFALTVTNNHRMWCRLGGDEAARHRIHTAQAIVRAGQEDASMVAQFEAALTAPNGKAGELTFFKQLHITTPDETEAFLELYGRWLRDGSLTAAEGISFGASQQPEEERLRALLARLPLVDQSEIPACDEQQTSTGYRFPSAGALTISSSDWCRLLATAPSSSSPASAVRAAPARVASQEASKSNQAIAPWVLDECTRDQLRTIIQGAADGQTGTIRTDTTQTRDQMVQLCLHAGYTATFEQATLTSQWQVNFTDRASASAPTLRVADECTVRKPEWSTVWCVSVPTEQQLIVVRKVLSSAKSASGQQVVTSASRPVIVGNTESNKNPGNAILYECVMTIMSIEAEGGLRVLAINILGRFLTNRDNNIRYVALNTLCKCVNKDTAAVQRHRNTVVDCLKDADISIRRRALDLIYALVTKNNVKALVKELLNYLALTSGDLEFKADLTEKICLVVERFAPSKHWHIETIVQVLQTAGNFTRENVATDLILLIARTPALHAYSVYKLFYSLYKKYKHAQLPLIHVVVWCCGEFGDMLTSETGYQAAFAVENANPADTANGLEPGTSETTVVTETMVLDLMYKVIKSPISQTLTRQYVLNALVKLTGRFSATGPEHDRLKTYLAWYQHSMNMELQQRSCEYTTLAGEALDKIRNGVVGRMPVPTKKAKKEEDATNKDAKKSTEEESSESEGSDTDSEAEAEAPAAKAAKPAAAAAAAVAKKPAAAPVVDIFGDLLSDAPPAASPAPSKPSVQSAGDLMDLFGGGSSAAPAQPASQASPMPFDIFGGSAPTPAAAAPSSLNSMGDLFGALPSSPSGASGLQTFPSEKVFESKGLSVSFSFSRAAATPELLNVTAAFSNSTSTDFTHFDFQVAVLKNVVLTMSPASSTVIPARSHGQVTQQLKLNNTLHGKKKLLIRVKIDYKINGQPQTEQAQIAQFPA